MEEIHKLRGQISNIVQSNFSDVNAGFMPGINPPDAFQVRLLVFWGSIVTINSCLLFLQVKVLCQLLTASFIDQVAVRKDLVEEATGNKFSTSKGVPYRAVGIEEDVFIHPSSVLFSASPPQYLVYHEVVRSSQAWIKGNGFLPVAWRGDAGLTSRCRANSDQPILDSHPRQVPLHILKSHQKQRWSHDGYPSIRSRLGTSSSESRFYLVDAMDTSCACMNDIMRGKYCRGLGCWVCVDEEAAKPMNGKFRGILVV